MDGPDQTAYVLRRETLGTDFVPLLQRLFAADVPKTVHDSKPLLRALLALGVEPAGIVFDTAVAAYLLDATRGPTPCRSWRRTICTSRLRTRPRSSRKASLPSGRPASTA